MKKPIIEIKGVKNSLGNQWVHKDINLTIYQGESIALIGASGCGKTTLLRNILMLLKPAAGEIRVFGKNLAELNVKDTLSIRQRWGVMFQQSALFSSMNVLENVMYGMQELTDLDEETIRHLAMLKIALVGLPLEAATKFPMELSGGMQRRAAAARAIAMDPELLFLDEPTSGLDPRSARLFDELIDFLRKALSLTVVMVSHDLESLGRMTDRVAFVGEGRILDVAPIAELMNNSNKTISNYFSEIKKGS